MDFRSCVLLEADGRLCEVVVGAALMGRSKSLGNTVVVGDVVRFEPSSGRDQLTEVQPRRNSFSRRASGERSNEQVVAANLDQLMVIASILDPEFKSGLVDRMLCQAEHAGIPARLVINKLDLGATREAHAILEGYARAGYRGHAVSARTGEGMDELRAACLGQRTLVVGHSGVGKSTLLNAMIPGLDLLSGQVNAKTGKGRHTTTAAWLVRPQPDLELIDTPGVRVFALWGIDARDLQQAYPEFRPYLGTCRFGDCRHDREPGCAIRAAVANGTISLLRLESFFKLREELERESARR